MRSLISPSWPVRPSVLAGLGWFLPGASGQTTCAAAAAAVEKEASKMGPRMEVTGRRILFLKHFESTWSLKKDSLGEHLNAKTVLSD